jgi:hypothetical protein
MKTGSAARAPFAGMMSGTGAGFYRPPSPEDANGKERYARGDDGRCQ